jgi:hypothetical protein
LFALDGLDLSDVYEYSINTGFDLSSSTAYVATRTLSNAQNDLIFNNDGSKVYSVRGGGNPVKQVSLSTNYDLTSTQTADGSLTLSSFDGTFSNLAFNDDGTKFFMLGGSDDKVYEFSVSTAFNLVESDDPTVSSASTTSTTTIDLTMSENVYDSSVTAGDFTISGAASNPTVTSISVSESTITLTLSADMTGDDTLLVSYTRTSGNIKDLSANTLANFANQSVTNNTPATSNEKNGGCGYACIKPPTMGLDKSGERLVTDGFSYNGNAIDVEQFFTPYPLLTVDVGRENLAEFKIYDSSGVDSIRHFEVGFGARDIGQPFSLIEPRVEINLYPDEEIVGILIDPENILENVTVSNSVVSCDEQNNSQCLKLSISHTFRESLEYNILATNMWDKNRHSSANYFNHGIEITGESLNPPDTYTGHHYRSSYHLTETGDNTAVDEFGDSWTLNGKWIKDYIAIAPDSDKITTILDRNHSEFYKIKSWTTDVAILKLLDICPTCMDESFEGFEESWSYEFPNRVDRVNDPKLNQAIFEQQVIAQKVMDQIMEP